MANNLSLSRTALGFPAAACIAFFIVAATGCGGAQRPDTESPRTAEKRPTLPALDIPSDPFQLLPAECFAGALLDVRAYRESDLYQAHGEPTGAELNPAYQRLLQYFLDQTESAALGVARDEKRPGKSRQHTVLILRGDYELVGILALLADLARGGRVEGLKSPGQEDEGGKGSFLEFYADRKSQGLILDEKTIVLSSRKLMPSVLEIAARPDSADRFASSELYRSMGEHAGFGRSLLSLVFSLEAGMADAMKNSSPAPSLFAKYDEAVRNITGVGASVALSDGIQLDAVAATTSDKYPPRLVELTNALIFAIGLIQQDKDFKQVVDAIHIKAEGKLVRASLHASEQQLLDLVEKIEVKVKSAADAEKQAPGRPSGEPPAEPSGKASK